MTEATIKYLGFNLVDHLKRQQEFSTKAFGPVYHHKRICDHIKKELDEIEENPVLEEWVDIILLGLDGAWRSGATSEQICMAIAKKQSINEDRTWPDWRAADPDKAIEHVK